ncbi:tripartite tricarboxylate transporter substrate binding protein [Roseomonas sp. AR75]|uniref:Bug family tripartite tricarboxylate transporter substrate binding protein n=1 Tax=Roseomonas sp. AR75 TaxID=2562311 RepID=UPI0014854967|nr:tripartite tricarboxylate transporter substrate binding protein [Roseomonas sp. AR75]
MRRRTFGFLAAALAAPSVARAAWPEKPVTVIVPYPPGGNNDILARLLAPTVEKQIGQPLVIENRGGGGGTIGAGAAARAPADGHTLLFADIGILAIAPHLFARLPYDPDAFAPVVRLTEVSLLVGVPKDSPHRTVADLVAAAKARPDALNFGTPGPGTAGHLATQMLMSLSGTKMTHVPFRGSAPAAQELIAGRIDLLIDGTLLPAVNQGTVRAIAVTGARRSPFTPDLPTVAESGVPGYAFTSWHGVVAPRGVPAEAVQKLNTAFNAALREPAVLERARQLGLPFAGGSAADFATWIQAERQKFGPLVQASGARVE